MTSEYIHFLNSKSKYIAIAIVLIIIASIKMYLGHSLHSKDALIMYTIDSPSGFSISLKEATSLGAVDILVDKGANLATQKFIDNFSVIQKATALAPTINIRPAMDTPLLKQNVPINIKIKLAPNQHKERIHILFHSRNPNGATTIGVLTNDSFSIVKNTLSFTTSNFGNYQLVTLPATLKKVLSLQSSLPVYKIRNNRLSIVYSNWSE